MAELTKGAGDEVMLILCRKTVYAAVWYNKKGIPLLKRGYNIIDLSEISNATIYEAGLQVTTGKESVIYGDKGRTGLAVVTPAKDKINVSLFSKISTETLDINAASKQMVFEFKCI